MKNIIIPIILVFLCLEVKAQTVEDALRYSLREVNGTARSIGMGGAVNALGRDFSNLSGNPAGLAAYRESEFVFTPSLSLTTDNATLAGEGNLEQKEQKTNFTINNIGVVFHRAPRASGWKSFNVGIGVNQTANHYQELYYEGNSPGSMAESFAELANGNAPETFDAFAEELAWVTGAIYSDPYSEPNANNYVTDFTDFPNRSIFRSETVNYSGRQNELSFALAGNYDDKLMIGATLGVPILSWKKTRRYAEEDTDDSIPFFNALNYEESIETNAVGINGQFGLIYKPIRILNIGLAVHTPTAFSMNDRYTSTLTYDYTDGYNDGALEEGSPDGSFNYTLYTPWRLIASTGILLGNAGSPHRGSISAEIEWADYSTAKFNYTGSENGAVFKTEERRINAEINNTLESAVIARIGGEYAYKLAERRYFAVQGGYRITGSSFADINDIRHVWSGGIGISERSFYLNFAYSRALQDNDYQPYYTVAAPQASVDATTNRDMFALTLGFKWGRR